MNRVVFFSRCRPQKSDPIDLVLRERRVFIGWPAWREGIQPRRGHLRECIIDLRCSEEEWASLYAGFGKDRKQYQQNRNFVHSIEPGAIALVPRPDRGVVFAGRVATPFELLDDLPWGDDYLSLRRKQGLDADDEFSHLADVAQCCQVDEFHEIPFPSVPSWVRRSLLGRSTYGHVAAFPSLGLDPYSVLEQRLQHPAPPARSWTHRPSEVQRRLLDDVGPNSFEHLCVALLQLEYPEQIWVHVGGSGDGGVDGIGADANGNVVGILQCKWEYWGGEAFSRRRLSNRGLRHILAALLHEEHLQAHEGVEFWPLSHIGSLVIKHANRLPLALSLRVRTSE